MNFKKLNIITGWVVFAIAMYTYVATLEPTVSLWDCGEYISTADKLEVGHPPGAPMFNMIGRMFTSMVGPESKALMINLMSALCSAFTILFMFWSITYLVRKLAEYGGKKLSDGDLIAVIASGAVGALAFAFSDSFWFSAVEGEVYAMSSFFTALVVWATFRWEDVADEPGADRWLIFIFFMMGISIGVHLLNLLAIPAIVYVYYFRRYSKATTKGFLLAGLIGMFILGFIQGALIPGMVSVPAWLERLFRNSFGTPFNFGAIFIYLVLIGLTVWGLFYSTRKGKAFMNTLLLCFTVLTIGYSCFFMIVIRSNANTPIDENNPEDANSFHSYLQREQYGSWPVLYGPYWNSAPDLEHEDGPYVDGNPIYMRGFVVKRDGEMIQGFRTKEEADVYIKEKQLGGVEVTEEYFIGDDRKNVDLRYRSDHMTVFPRMFSREPRHIAGYKAWSGYDPSDAGETFTNPFTGQPDVLPTFGNNLQYFFSYQLGWMYWRYFMWNFAGRQNDEQAINDQPLNGNWISGINFIDAEHVGDQSKLPSIIRENKAYNRFFFLPLILGLIGMIFHIWRSPKDWFILLLLFLFTGIMIIVYLNSKPYEPRERDYAYAGSFYAFAFWIGIGVYALYDLARSIKLKQLTLPLTIVGGVFLLRYLLESASGQSHTTSYSILFMGLVAFAAIILMIYLHGALKNERTIAIIAAVLALPVPALMLQQGWDDHDRSNRYTALDFAYNYLSTVEKNAIIFTHGDNDTFPLWYAQEVEGIRPDVRIVNLSLLGTDWYIDQMIRKAYTSDPVPFSAPEYLYRQGGLLDYVELEADPSGKPMDLREGLKFVMNDDNARKRQDGGKTAFIPNRTFTYKVDKSLIEKYKVIPAEDMGKVVPEILFTVPKTSLYKNDLMILDLIANNDWKRPVYFAGAADSKTYLGLQNYFSMEGLSYKFVPISSPNGNPQMGYGKVDEERMYNNLMKNYKWGNLDKKGVHADYYVRRTMTNNYRMLFLSLGEHFGKKSRNATGELNFIESQVASIKTQVDSGKVPAGAADEQIAKLREKIPTLQKTRDEANEKIKNLMRRCMQVLPEENVPYTDRVVLAMMTNLILMSGDMETGQKLSTRLLKLETENLDFYLSKHPRFAPSVASQAFASAQIIGMMEDAVKEHKAKPLEATFKDQKKICDGKIRNWMDRLRNYDVENGTSYSAEVIATLNRNNGYEE